jgi:hypothetical protein
MNATGPGLESTREPLDECHRCAAPFANAVMLPRTSPLIGEERAEECAEHVACELGIPGAAVPSALAPFGAGRSSQPEAIPQPDELAREFRSALAELTTIA